MYLFNDKMERWPTAGKLINIDNEFLKIQNCLWVYIYMDIKQHIHIQITLNNQGKKNLI